MLPVTLTLAALLTSAGTVVTQFADVITLVAGLAVGVFVVRFVIHQIRAAA